MFTSPWDMQPTTKTTGLPLFRLELYSSMSTKRLFSEQVMTGQPMGKWSVIGFLITLSRISELSPALILYFVSNWAIRPANLLNVLGILVLGFISINTLFFVLMYTCNIPALFKGESKRESRHYQGKVNIYIFIYFWKYFWNFINFLWNILKKN